MFRLILDPKVNSPYVVRKLIRVCDLIIETLVDDSHAIVLGNEPGGITDSKDFLGKMKLGTLEVVPVFFSPIKLQFAHFTYLLVVMQSEYHVDHTAESLV